MTVLHKIEQIMKSQDELVKKDALINKSLPKKSKKRVSLSG